MWLLWHYQKNNKRQIASVIDLWAHNKSGLFIQLFLLSHRSVSTRTSPVIAWTAVWSRYCNYKLVATMVWIMFSRQRNKIYGDKKSPFWYWRKEKPFNWTKVILEIKFAVLFYFSLLFFFLKKNYLILIVPINITFKQFWNIL